MKAIDLPLGDVDLRALVVALLLGQIRLRYQWELDGLNPGIDTSSARDAALGRAFDYVLESLPPEVAGRLRADRERILRDLVKGSGN